MKRCPECRRDYLDETLKYCLDDGSLLLDGPASMDEPATAIISVPSSSAGGHFSESATRAQIHTAEAEPQRTFGDTVEKRSSSTNRAAKPLVAAAIAILSLIGGSIAYRSYFNSPDNGQINSIAVLPFQNRSDDTDTDYLSDGLAESLIFRLTQLPGLKVSPTSSVMRYKGEEADIAKIANELGVDAVMTGRLMKRGDYLNISVELVDTRNNKSLWGEQYERKVSDLLSTQREIASTIAGKLQLRLTGNEAGISKKFTSSNEAFQLYLKGRFHWAKRKKDDADRERLFQTSDRS